MKVKSKWIDVVVVEEKWKEVAKGFIDEQKLRPPDLQKLQKLQKHVIKAQ